MHDQNSVTVGNFYLSWVDEYRTGSGPGSRAGSPRGWWMRQVCDALSSRSLKARVHGDLIKWRCFYRKSTGRIHHPTRAARAGTRSAPVLYSSTHNANRTSIGKVILLSKVLISLTCFESAISCAKPRRTFRCLTVIVCYKASTFNP